METPILILEDALNQQVDQLRQLNKKRIFHNDKQLKLVNKAKKNLKDFIAEINEALNILKSNEPKTVSNNRQPQNFCECTQQDGTMIDCTEIEYCVDCGQEVEQDV